MRSHLRLVIRAMDDIVLRSPILPLAFLILALLSLAL